MSALNELYDWLAQPHPFLTTVAYYTLLLSILSHVRSIRKKLTEEDD